MIYQFTRIQLSKTLANAINLYQEYLDRHGIEDEAEASAKAIRDMFDAMSEERDLIANGTAMEPSHGVVDSDRIAELEAENAYLSYFSSNADFGPAHTDVVMAIQRQYEEEVGKPVPADWLYE